jgi:hypothetical protein
MSKRICDNAVGRQLTRKAGRALKRYNPITVQINSKLIEHSKN